MARKLLSRRRIAVTLILVAVGYAILVALIYYIGSQTYIAETAELDFQTYHYRIAHYG